jgi:diguanylate cyclase (GGDEF)-like protein
VPGDVALQTVAVALTATALGALLLAIRVTTERRFREHTRALAEVNDRLEELNRTDALTGLPNRRRLDETLDRAWQRAGAEGRPVSLLMVDIDHFKEFNDHYGHLGGDACLAKVAEALAAGIRDGDVVARFGGEEFSVILPDADLELATRIAERIRHQIALLRAEHPTAPDGLVSVSVGVASAVPAGDDTPRDLIKLADQALYEAKRNGRNRVEVTA